MRIARTGMALFVLAAASGCASSNGFPDPVVSTESVITEVQDSLTVKAVTDCNAALTRSCRNNIIDARVRASNARFSQFERELYVEGIGFGVGTDWATLAINGIATFSKSAAPELAALSAAIIGGRASYEKQALYNLSLPVMLAQMVAKRQEVLVRVRAGQTKELADYTLYRGLDDVDEYHRAGSIPAAMSEMINNAGAQADEAKQKLEEIDQVALVPPDIQQRRETIAAKLKAAQVNELSVFLRISGQKSGGNPLIDSLNLLEDARTGEALDTFCTRLQLTVPSAGGC